MRATPPEQVARDLDWAYDGAPPPAAARVLLDDPARGMAQLTELMTAYWRRVIEPHWPAIRATLEADIAYRAGRLTEGGPLAAFADLHEEVALARRRARRRPRRTSRRSSSPAAACCSSRSRSPGRSCGR